MRVGFGSITKEKGGEIQPEFQPVSDALTNSATPWRCGIGTEDGGAVHSQAGLIAQEVLRTCTGPLLII